MDLRRYDSLNEKLKLCYDCLRGEHGKLSDDDKLEIIEEAKEYKREMDLLLEV